MSEGIGRKKKVCGGHRGSAICTVNEVYETIESLADKRFGHNYIGTM